MSKGDAKPTLAQMRAFIASLDAGSVTAGAAELNITQSAVSHSISSLENSLGARLLRRSKAGVKATAVGSKVAVHIRHVLQQVEIISQEASKEHGHLEGELYIASFRSAATHILPTLIVLFNKLHPLISVSVQSWEGVSRGAEKAVLQGKADVAMVPLPVSRGLTHWEIARDEWVAICPDKPQFAPEALDWSVFESVPFIMCNEGGAEEVRSYLMKQGCALKIVGQVSDDSVILSMVAHGLAWSMLPRIALEPLPNDVLVRHLPAAFERIIGLAAPEGLARAPAASAFIKLARSIGVLEHCAVVQAGYVRPAPSRLPP